MQLSRDLLESLKDEQGVFPNLPDVLHCVRPLGVHWTPPTRSALEVVVLELLARTRIDDIITEDVKDPSREPVGGAGVTHVSTISTNGSSHWSNPESKGQRQKKKIELLPVLQCSDLFTSRGWGV